MKAPEHFRPYNHEHAQAGAPICLRCGAEVEIHYFWTTKAIGMHKAVDGEWHAGEWNASGEWITGQANRMDLVMPPLGTIEGKPVFVGDKIEAKLSGTICEASPQDRFNEPMAWGWPKPAPKLPLTNMTEDELVKVYCDTDGCFTSADGYRSVANAAIARAIEDGQVVPTGYATKYKFGQVVVYEVPGAEPVVVLNERQYLPAEMLEKVAMRVQRRCIEEAEYFTNGVQLGRNISRVDLAAIIASVKAGAA